MASSVKAKIDNKTLTGAYTGVFIEFNSNEYDSFMAMINTSAVGVNMKVEYSYRASDEYFSEVVESVASATVNDANILERNLVAAGKHAIPVKFVPFEGKIRISFKGTGTVSMKVIGVKYNRRNF